MIELLVSGESPEAAHAFRRRIAGCAVGANVPLRGFSVASCIAWRSRPSVSTEASRRIAVRLAEQRADARIIGDGDLREVDLPQGKLLLASDQAVFVGDRRDAELCLLGPGLLYALAGHARYALHGSALAMADGAVLFLGASGVGKSSLARHAAAAGGIRLADDLCLVSALPIPLLYPDYPQLKLSLAEEAAIPRAPVAVTGIAVLQRGEAPPKSLPARDALPALLAHSVASRLFDVARTRDLLAALAHLVAAIPVWQLSVATVDPPRRPATFDRLLAEAANLR